MSQGAVLHLLCAFGFFHQCQTSLVQSQQLVLAALGDNTYLTCWLMDSKDVVQVTWQKIIAGGTTDLASYNKHFGQKVNTGFQGRVEIKSAGLQNSSIVIRNVTHQDKGCYRCLFNTYPDGAFTGRSCLQLYELHGPFLHVTESHSAEELVVSCSATGPPVPTVTLTVPHHNSTSVTNTNGTVTVTTTAVLSRLHDNSHRVGCAARVLSGRQIDVYEMIPEVRLSPPDDVPLITGVVVGVICVVVVVVVVAVFVFCLKRKHQNSVPQRPRTPLMDPEVRQRTSSVKPKRRDNEEPSVQFKRNLMSVQQNPED
uniref:OX-2 membrane glycoprotein-like isoform X7 n=1 Tax=Gasterosteus aculeatus aculeatus TaxID=481459 RepID=UPI001A983DD3|nr:OX-2 membrane glycoprotein-like isoform X7 [Gasterosteus aculeatus aculeatus]